MKFFTKALALAGSAAIAFASFVPTASATGKTHLTTQEQSAAADGLQYLSLMPFSRLGLISQLSGPGGDGYSVHNATIGIDSLTVNYKHEAVLDANSYIALMPFSCSGLIGQLDGPGGDQYTVVQAAYGADHSKDGC
jgi:hypothetical protein